MSTPFVAENRYKATFLIARSLPITKGSLAPSRQSFSRQAITQQLDETRCQISVTRTVAGACHCSVFVEWRAISSCEATKVPHVGFCTCRCSRHYRCAHGHYRVRLHREAWIVFTRSPNLLYQDMVTAQQNYEEFYFGRFVSDEARDMFRRYLEQSTSKPVPALLTVLIEMYSSFLNKVTARRETKITNYVQCEERSVTFPETEPVRSVSQNALPEIEPIRSKPQSAKEYNDQEFERFYNESFINCSSNVLTEDDEFDEGASTDEDIDDWILSMVADSYPHRSGFITQKVMKDVEANIQAWRENPTLLMKRIEHVYNEMHSRTGIRRRSHRSGRKCRRQERKSIESQLGLLQKHKGGLRKRRKRTSRSKQFRRSHQ